MVFDKRGTLGLGARAGRATRTYRCRHRSYPEAGPGWRGIGFSMSPGQEAHDAEVKATTKGLLLLVQQGSEGQSFAHFTDPQATMTRIANDSPGPGRELALVATGLAEHPVARGNTIDVRWAPAHQGVDGNKQEDQRAKEAATREWRRDIEERNVGRRVFRLPAPSPRPGVRPQFRGVPKRIAARYFQLLSGHAVVAPFLKEKWGWIDRDMCWWCEKGRQSRANLFKECTAWTKEIR